MGRLSFWVCRSLLFPSVRASPPCPCATTPSHSIIIRGFSGDWAANEPVLGTFRFAADKKISVAALCCLFLVLFRLLRLHTYPWSSLLILRCSLGLWGFIDVNLLDSLTLHGHEKDQETVKFVWMEFCWSLRKLLYGRLWWSMMKFVSLLICLLTFSLCVRVICLLSGFVFLTDACSGSYYYPDWFSFLFWAFITRFKCLSSRKRL